MVLAEHPADDHAKAMAEDVMVAAGKSLVGVVGVDVQRLRMMAGLGRMRALRLLAAAELGRRVAVAEASAHDYVRSDSDVVRIMEPMMGSLQHEECWALYLASSGKVLDRVRISQGGVQSTVVDCKLVIRRALELLAVQVHRRPLPYHPGGQGSFRQERRSRSADPDRRILRPDRHDAHRR